MMKNKILLLLAALTIGSNSTAGTGQVELTSPYSYQVTVEKISSSIEKAGMTVFARIDHRAAAQSVGLDMPSTMVLIYGNPKGGTPLMLKAPAMALDLPLRVLIREDSEGHIVVGFHEATELVRTAGLPDENAHGLTKAETLIRAAIK